MKPSSTGSRQRVGSHLFAPWLLAAPLLGVALAPGCSSDSSATDLPVELGVNIALIDGKAADDPVLLHCDGTIAVEVTLSADPEERPFVLRPARACGTSGRCGYVRLQALDGSGDTLAIVDTATTGGVLQLATEDLARVAEIRASLRRGIDDQPVLNPDQSEVTTTVSPMFVQPSGCPMPSGGSAGAANQAGAGGQPTGAGGAPSEVAGGSGGAAEATGGTGETAGGAETSPGGGGSGPG
jgi:hypothetical protein